MLNLLNIFKYYTFPVKAQCFIYKKMLWLVEGHLFKSGQLSPPKNYCSNFFLIDNVTCRVAGLLDCSGGRSCFGCPNGFLMTWRFPIGFLLVGSQQVLKMPAVTWSCHKEEQPRTAVINHCSLFPKEWGRKMAFKIFAIYLQSIITK